jgi:hypothetical protein
MQFREALQVVVDELQGRASRYAEIAEPLRTMLLTEPVALPIRETTKAGDQARTFAPAVAPTADTPRRRPGRPRKTERAPTSTAPTKPVRATVAPPDVIPHERGSLEEPTVKLIAAHPGLRLVDIARRQQADTRTMFHVLKRLIAAKRIVREGPGYYAPDVTN